MRDYRKLKVFPLAHSLVLFVYKITRGFPVDERYGMVTEMRKTARSIAANLMEACGRRSRNEQARFVDISTGSANELLYYDMLARDLEYMSPDLADELRDRTIVVLRMLVALARAIRERPDLDVRAVTRTRGHQTNRARTRDKGS